MTILTFDAVGRPAPKGSVTRLPNGGMVHAGTKAGRERLASWETAVKDAAIRAVDEVGWKMCTGPVDVRIHLRFERGASHTYDTRHVVPIDADKAARLIGDVLQQTGVIRNDSQIWQLVVTKQYTDDGRTGAHVVVRDCTDDEAADRDKKKSASAAARKSPKAQPAASLLDEAV